MYIPQTFVPFYTSFLQFTLPKFWSPRYPENKFQVFTFTPYSPWNPKCDFRLQPTTCMQTDVQMQTTSHMHLLLVLYPSILKMLCTNDLNIYTIMDEMFVPSNMEPSPVSPGLDLQAFFIMKLVQDNPM